MICGKIFSSRKALKPPTLVKNTTWTPHAKREEEEEDDDDDDDDDDEEEEERLVGF